MILITILSTLFLNTSGWVSVPRPEKHPLPLEEESSAWVVFGKKVGEDTLLVRFPSDPHYTVEEGKYHIWAEVDNQIFHLIVVPKGGEVEKFGKEKIIETATHLYSLQIEGESSSPYEEFFFQSISVD